MSPKNKKNKKEDRKKTPIARGMHDSLPHDAPYWEKIETTAKDIAREHGFVRIEPPILESADLYRKALGEEIDEIEKEMCFLKTKGDHALALRPEYTTGICRAYIEHSLNRQGQPQKLFSLGPVFRHDRPHLGQCHEQTQVNFEIIGGSNDPIYDAEIISMYVDFLSELKIKDFTLKLNSIGCKTCRPTYRRQLHNFYKNYDRSLCEDCKKHFSKNQLRLLDCKNERCATIKEGAPDFLNKICTTCSTHFKSVLEYLDEANISYTLDNHLIQGFEYYSRTVFGFFSEEKESGLFATGGRYDYLVEKLGGRSTAGVGIAGDVERIIAEMKAKEIAISKRSQKRVFLAHAGEPAKKKAFSLLQMLRANGIRVVEVLAKESLTAQLKVAHKEGLDLALIIGQKEIFEKSVIIRDLKAGAQETVSLEKIIAQVKKRL